MSKRVRLDGRIMIGGNKIETLNTIEVVEPYAGRVAGTVHQADPEHVDCAVGTVRRGHYELAAMPLHKRSTILRRTAEGMQSRSDELAFAISRQTGKAIKDARLEVGRAVSTMRATASAAERFTYTTASPDAVPGGEGLTALVRREPAGVVAAITPFNAPLNLLVHKVAPALAVGNGVVIKPPPQAPFSAFQLTDALLEAGLPPDAIAVLPGDAETGSLIVGHENVDVISFTGSVPVGEQIAREAGIKRLVLELGGNSPSIVHHDADVRLATEALASGGFSNAGQSCNSVQRILVHESCYSEVAKGLKQAAEGMVVGDPLDDAVDVGTLVDESAATRVDSMIASAIEEGAKLIAGGVRKGAQLPPTVLGEGNEHMRVSSSEIFGPVVVLMRYTDFEEAIRMANATPYGLQAAIFTRSLSTAFRAIEDLRFGGVMVNRASKLRLDHFPFGGVKKSGLGRESAYDSLCEFTVTKTVLIDTGM